MVSNIFYFHPYLGKWSILTNIFQMGWNHQLVGEGCGCGWILDEGNLLNTMDCIIKMTFLFMKRQRFCSHTSMLIHESYMTPHLVIVLIILISLLHCALSLYAISQVHQKPFLMFSNLRWSIKPLRYAKMRDTQVRCKKKASNFIGKGWIFFFKKQHTRRVTLGDFHHFYGDHGKTRENHGVSLPFGDVGGARAFPACSTAPTDTWALIWLRPWIPYSPLKK